MTRLVLTVAYEGGYYSPDRNPLCPIRIYSDRRVQDDIVTRLTGKKWCGRLSRSEYRHARKAALLNKAEGRVGRASGDHRLDAFRDLMRFV